MSPARSPHLLGRPRVLIIDDVSSNIEILGEALSQDYDVRFACSGQEGLDIALADPPDVILLDVVMPEMDGFEVCRRLKDLDDLQNIPVIFVTARDAEEDQGIGLSLGAVDYITKPFNPALVRMRVRNHAESKRRADLLASLAMIDGLTHLPNRRRFDEQLELEWKHCQRDAVPLSLLLMDIDDFKGFNDHFGHGEGDACLQRVADALAKAAHRPTDLLARYGGEEFVAILPNTDAIGARQVGERLRAAVEALAIPHAPREVGRVVTLSVGCATGTPHNPDLTPSALLKAADDQLYAAKRDGRNRVCPAS
jgi:diguanylate cyclase (GGDEF)-like protein